MDSEIPTPPSERRAWAIAGALVVLGVGVLVAVLSGRIGQTASPATATRANEAGRLPVAATPTPAPASGVAGGASGLSTLAQSTLTQASPVAARSAIVTRPATAAQRRALASFVSLPPTQTHIAASWMAGFYPIYAEAQRVFGVNWLLLASIHRQESAFSTAPSTYHGLNFAGCCGGPMQFNVTNGGAGTGSTWALVGDSYIYGRRPAAYDHMTARHPSIYDDFDAIMAAGRLLSSDGATMALDAGAWGAAYGYYGHDAAGIVYADEVLARAISWSQHGWCINCGADAALLAAVHAAYGAPVAEAEEAAVAAAAQAPPRRPAVSRTARPRRSPPR